ncbi:MAG: polyprenyl synthetase family protein [Chloroflexota bacterium]
MKQLPIIDLIADQLERVEEKLREPDPTRHSAINLAVDHLLGGGKRVRPAVVLLTCGMLKADFDSAVNLAAAVEMLHTATLVHDDVIDGSMVRRGIPTLNANWSDGATILTGDYFFARAADLAAQTNNVVVMRLFARALMTICNGELRQMFTSNGITIDRDEYIERIFAKTGALFVLSTEATSVLAGASSPAQQSLYSFGRELGIAFQIVDDLLDFVGSQDRVGKPLGSDLAQGLITLPTLLYLEDNPGDELTLKILRGEHTPSDLSQALHQIRESSAIDRTREEAARHVKLAKQELESFDDNPYHQALHQVADLAVLRDF